MEKKIKGGVIIGYFEEPAETRENVSCAASKEVTEELKAEVKKVAKKPQKTASAKK